MPLPTTAPGRARRAALSLLAATLLLAVGGASQAAAADVVLPPPPILAGTSVTFTATDTAVAPTWSVSGPGEPIPGGTELDFEVTFPVPGEYTVTMTLPPAPPATPTDPPGAPVVVQKQVTVHADAPPTLVVTASPAKVAAGQAVTFTAVASSPVGRPVEVTWDTNGDGSFGTPGPTATKAFPAGGTTVRARATDAVGQTAEVAAGAEVQVVLPTAGIELDAPQPLQGQLVTLTSTSTDPQGDDTIATAEWTLPGVAEPVVGTSVAHRFTAAGPNPVTLTVTDASGEVASTTLDVEVRPNGAPIAGFVFDPATVLPGVPVAFASTASDPDANLVQQQWDLNGDGQFGEVLGDRATWAWAEVGPHPVGLRVVDEAGLEAEHFDTVQVVAPPAVAGPAGPEGAPAGSDAPPVGPAGGAPAGPPPGGRPAPAPAARPALMAPFPVVRIAGSVFRRSARIRLLTVQLPRAARAEVRCSGRGCPFRVRRRSAPSRGRGSTATVRFRELEGRRLRAGASLVVRVTKAGTIGKYTRFRIRAGLAPSRVDRCVEPGSREPVECPG
jgi:PKD repeat protein